MCSSGCVRQTHSKQIFVISSPPMKCNGTKLGVIYQLNSLPVASPLRFTVAAIALVYWRSNWVHSSGCVRWMYLKQIFVSYSPTKKCTGTKLGGVHCSNSRPGASPLIFNRFTIAIVCWSSYKVCSSGCVRRTHLKQIFISYSSPRKCTCTMLRGVHCSNSRPGASQLIFDRFAIADIAIVYWSR